MFIEWSDKLLTGNAEIDDQHKEIFDRAARLLNKANQTEIEEKATEIINDLEEYILKHLAAEELLQASYDFPQHEAHREIHENFRQQVTQMKTDIVLQGINYERAAGIIVFMLKWLAEHIDKFDRDFAAFMKNAPTKNGMPTK